MASADGASLPHVRVVVVNHDGGAVTLRCLDALKATAWPADRLEVVLVDNASKDGVVEQVRRTRPEVVLIESSTNEGFGRACNRALRDLTGVDYVALINNDAMPEPGWLAPLVAALEQDGGLGAVSPKVLLAVSAFGVVLHQDPDDPAVITVGELLVDGEPLGDAAVPDERFRPALGGRPHRWSTGRAEAGLWWPAAGRHETSERLQLELRADREVDATLTTPAEQIAVRLRRTAPSEVVLQLPSQPERVINSVGGVLYEGWYGGDRGYLELDRGQYDEPAEVFSWSGSAVLLRPAYLRHVGLFNPAFFLYYEDFELSWRGRLQGWGYRSVPESIVYHEHGYTTGIGSARFRAWEERSRWMTLVELAPRDVAARLVKARVRSALGRRRPPTGGTQEGLRPVRVGRMEGTVCEATHAPRSAPAQLGSRVSSAHGPGLGEEPSRPRPAGSLPSASGWHR